MKKIKFLYPVVILFWIAVWGCQKDDVTLTDIQNFNRPINLDAPIFQLHLSSLDLLERLDSNQNITTYSDGLLYLRVDSTFTVGNSEVITFDDMVLDKTYPLPGGAKAVVPVTYTDTIEASNEVGQRLDSMNIRTAQMEININTPTGFTGTFTVEFPELTFNGISLKLNGNIGQPFNQTVACDRYNLTFFQNDEDISSFHSITTINPEIPGSGTPAGDFHISFTFKIFEPELIWGYFSKKEVYNHTGEFDFNFAEGFDFDENIEFKDPRLYMSITNYFGIPVLGNFDSLLFLKEGKAPVLLEISDGSEINVSPATFGNPVIPAKDSLFANNTNSNIVDGVNLWPEHIRYSVSGIINANGDEGQNFIVNDGHSDLYTDVRIELPFWFKSNGYNRTDTIEFVIQDIIGDSATLDIIEELNLFFDFKNGFPFDILGQAYAMDEQGNVVDSLFSPDQTIWKSPVIDANGKPGAAVLNKVDIQLMHDRVKKWWDKEVVQIQLKSKLYTGGLQGTPTVPEFAKLYDDNMLDMKLSIKLISGELSN